MGTGTTKEEGIDLALRRGWAGGIILLSKTSSDNLVVTERISVHNASPPTHQATQQAQTALMIFF